MSFFPEEKSRTNHFGPRYSWRTAPFVGATFGPPSYLQGQVTETILSQCHLGTWPPMRGSRDDVGGLMNLNRVHQSWPEVVQVNNGTYKGDVLLASTNLFHLLPSTSSAYASESTINAFGTSAVAAVLPTNPSASLATALGELHRDGLPSLPGSRMRDQVDLARRSGNEFLNVEFGWLPLVSDVTAFADAVKRSRQLIDQYKRDSDRKIRRRFTPVPLVLRTDVFSGVGQATGGTFMPNTTVTRDITERYSFSGAFRYHVPVGDDFYSRLRRYEQYSNRLFGLRITPEVLWELAPWSWAVDWFTNAQSVIHNISALGADGLVMQYGYAMRHERVNELARGFFSYTQAGKAYSGTVSKLVYSESKQRRRANPYGFGIDDLSLSAIQLAILSALGLTRGQRASK